ncbi:HNH endonuclease family protein [Actinocatenispora comari]|uniref:GmrSD restriction endonucleases C-terminal domain-containing protein n=1 Tax=Actinocatenispora comari TaxID=2807577 RepID=A0A8J4AEL6_9ACTN|nr:HNH endonuclease family protein [Actinocatenispora comari]GIL28205.1 hypothetical protein NUM_34590 [Actinocatenispora comari]
MLASPLVDGGTFYSPAQWVSAMTIPVGAPAPPPKKQHGIFHRILVIAGTVLGSAFVLFVTLGILGATGVLPAADTSASPTPAGTQAAGDGSSATTSPGRSQAPAATPHHSPTTAAPPSHSPAPPRSTAPETVPPAAAPTAGPQDGEGTGTAASAALAELAKLPVKPAASMAGYSRDQYGHGWIDTDHNGCDTRNDILRRDLSGVAAKAGTHGCVVAGGVLSDHYTGTTITFHRGETTSTAVEIDHLVALADAWRTGAQSMSTDQREQFANDPIELLAVSGPANESKGDQDASQWLPPNNAFDCTYVADQITVKATYGLWVTSAEHDVMASTLRDCGGAAPRPHTTTVAPPPPPATTPAPPPDTSQAPPTHSTDNGGGASVVHPGAFCSSEGAVGVTDRGTPMRCTSKNGDQPRWRSAD